MLCLHVTYLSCPLLQVPRTQLDMGQALECVEAIVQALMSPNTSPTDPPAAGAPAGDAAPAAVPDGAVRVTAGGPKGGPPAGGPPRLDLNAAAGRDAEGALNPTKTPGSSSSPSAGDVSAASKSTSPASPPPGAAPQPDGPAGRPRGKSVLADRAGPQRSSSERARPASAPHAGADADEQ